MDEYCIDKKVEGIFEVWDEMDCMGFWVVVELKKEVDVKGILNFLYKNMDLQIMYNFNMVVIYNCWLMLMSFMVILDVYIFYQKEVVINCFVFEL